MFSCCPACSAPGVLRRPLPLPVPFPLGFVAFDFLQWLPAFLQSVACSFYSASLLAAGPQYSKSLSLKMAAVTGFCPKGGTFYVCQGNTTQFLGCCTKDPCADGSGDCPQDSLRYTSYNADEYSSIPPEDCSSSGLWYTCSEITTAFMGCCLDNPCQNDGCTQGNLTAARLSDNTTDAAAFETLAASLTDTNGKGTGTLSTGATVGIAIGAAVVALIVGIALFFLYKRRERNKSQNERASTQYPPDGTPGVYMPSPYHGKDSAR